MATAILEKNVATKSESPASPLDRPHLITVERYLKMVETGVFNANDPVYLWKETLVEKMSKNEPHNIAGSELNRLLVRMIPEGWFVRPEQPIALGGGCVPEPDFTIVRGKSRDFPRYPPKPTDVCLLIEVADSSLGQDRGEVLRTYAAHKIPISWIVNIAERQIEVYTKPFGKGENAKYREIRVFKEEANVPVVLDGREVGAIKVQDVLP